ncbi:MAG TPA: beta-ketoacyl-ACP synthase II [Candidatus Binatia bacterium]|nr:beta-ketoacyl-ACP synthase II [Candidatus Binatia bacterium]
MEKRRVVVTGLGAITPIGNTYPEFWDALVAGASGVATITSFDTTDFPSHIAAEIKGFDPIAHLGRRDARHMDRYAQFAVIAAEEAVRDAQLPDDAMVRDETGAIIATGIGGVITLQEADRRLFTEGPGRISPFFVPMLMANAAGAQVSLRHKLRGPVYAVSSACASANDALAVAYRTIASGDATAMLAGGAEATITPLTFAGFCVMKALSTRNDEPERASRPFDAERDGFVLGEGGAILVLEELEFARKRGARIYAEVLGFGQSSDAHHLVAPEPGGAGIALALKRAFASCGITPEEVSYINAHATSTQLGDVAESRAIETIFGEAAQKVAISSTKSMTGHLLGAAGAIEGVATALAVYHDIIPPTINYEFPDPECRLDYVPNVARRASVEIGLSNGFGFGGHNSVAVFKKYRGG